ncbi:unnamed protein product [Leuciscus chuanchicus]
MASLTEYEKDLVLLGKLSCHFHNSKMTRCSKKKVQQECQHQRTDNYVNGKRVCRETFTFLHCFAELHGLVLPGRVPGYKRFDIKLLASHYTKATVFQHRVVNIVTFQRLWKTLVPYIVRTKPMTDFCWECQKNNSTIYKSANLTEAEKSER